MYFIRNTFLIETQQSSKGKAIKANTKDDVIPKQITSRSLLIDLILLYFILLEPRTRRQLIIQWQSQLDSLVKPCKFFSCLQTENIFN